MSAMKLLVVDDERPIVKHMDALLTGWGHKVVSLCLDGELTPADVLEQVKLQKFDVALVDNFKMPPLLGTDLPAQIKRLSPATKIIIMVAGGWERFVDWNGRKLIANPRRFFLGVQKMESRGFFPL